MDNWVKSKVSMRRESEKLQVGTVDATSAGTKLAEDPSQMLSFNPELTWKTIKAEGLNLQYAILFGKSEAGRFFDILEREVVYYTGNLTKIFVFGKWRSIPRQQVAYGDEGLSYKFSGTCIPAKPWLPELSRVRDLVGDLTGHRFNFVLVNRYKDGMDHIGEHRDDEKELDERCPIVSVSLGQHRDMVFRHANSRSGRKSSCGGHTPDPVTVTLEHGSVLLMNPPTNRFWYHSLPVRKRALHPRINLTFRKIVASPSA